MLKTEAEKSIRVGKTIKIKIIMKKSKLNLNDLKVESFVTDINAEKSETVKGGLPIPVGTIFDSQCCSDDDHCFSMNGNCQTIFERECHKQ